MVFIILEKQRADSEALVQNFDIFLQVFVFMVSNTNWKFYDWNKITTIASFTTFDPDLLCYAHSKGVRIVPKGKPPSQKIFNVQ